MDDDYDTDDDILRMSMHRIESDLDLVFNELFYKETSLTALVRNARLK